MVWLSQPATSQYSHEEMSGVVSCRTGRISIRKLAERGWISGAFAKE
jgi:hypothetical protein